ncbi:hypothetical protein [Clostridium rectalis]|uniref:hypothetical protein n=1 Tax=Clostridium rectalis TaxID=2040295 RepID=UPI000F644827|nr:hypothetical protein [Clostridium rectalis]
MPESIEVKPTPIQRNPHDVAIELLNIYLKNNLYKDKFSNVDDLRKLYLEFYSTVKMADSIHFEYLKEYLPEELKKVVGEFEEIT